MTTITENDIRVLLEDILDDDLPEFTPETSAKDVPGWDSLNHVRLLLRIEQKYSVDIPVAEVEKLANVGDMVRLVNSLLA